MDLVGFLTLLRRRAVPLLLCLVVGIVGALVVTSQTDKIYRARTTVIVTPPATVNGVAGANQGLTFTSELIPSYANIATSRRVATRVKQQLSLPESAEAVRGKLGAFLRGKTLLLDITATDLDPERARSIADATALALSAAVREIQAGRDPQTVVTVDIVDNALTPRSPLQPRPTYNLVLGLVVGLASGVALSLALDALDRTVKSAEQAEAGAGAPVLGLLPKFRRGAPTIVTASDANDPMAEAYRTLRTSVRFLDPDHPLQVIAVTSPSAGEGKTTTAVNLAIALAQSGERVLLIDADLRRASVATTLGLEGANGVSTVVTRRAPLSSALQTWYGQLTVLPSGALPPNPSEIVGSQSMGALLDEARKAFDIVIVDAPPVIPVTDAVVLSTQVDGVLLVARAGQTQRALLAEARRRLEGVGASVVGVVVNAVNTSSTEGYYTIHRTGAGVTQA